MIRFLAGILLTVGMVGLFAWFLFCIAYSAFLDD